MRHSWQTWILIQIRVTIWLILSVFMLSRSLQIGKFEILLMFSRRAQAGTDVTVKIPIDLQVIATAGSAIGKCREAAYSSVTNSYQNATISNCIYNEYIGYSAITFKISQTYSDIQAYYFYVGLIRNPPSVRYTDSFEVALTNGYPTGSFNQGLILNYIPNKIYSATLTHNLVQAGTTDTYTFKFKITNNILQRGFLQLVFPSPWTSAPQTILSMTGVNIYGATKSGFSVQTPITQTVTYSSLFDLSGVTADATKFITLTITGINNPSSIQTTGSFSITTLDDAMQEIDQITTGLTIAITQPGLLTIDSFTVNDKTVDAFTLIQFTITPSAKYTSGGYIEVTCPAAYMSTSTTVSCVGILGTLGSSTCTRLNSQTIRFTRNLSSGLLVSFFQISFSVGNFRNYLGVVTNTPFTISFKEADGSTVAQSTTGVIYTTVAGTVTVTSAIRATTVLTVGLSGAQYTLTFTCKTRVPTVGRFVFTFPDEQVAYSATTTCQDASGNDLACTLAQVSGTFTATIAASKYCTTECPAGSTFTMKLINAKNPSYINSPLTNSVQIQTQNLFGTNYVTIDQITSGVYFTNSLVPGTLLNMNLARSGSALTGAVPIYTLSFQTATILPNGAVFSITFPQNTAYYSSTATITCTVQASSKTCTSTALGTDSTQISSVLISSACSSTTCAALTTYSVVITNFVNPFSTLANSLVAFTIQTKVSSSNGLVDSGTFNAAQLSLNPNVLTVALTAPTTPIIVGDITSYTLTVTNPTNKIPSTTDSGRLEVIFPSQVVIQSTTCSAQTTTITLTCVASISTQTVTVTSATELSKGQTITIQLINNVQNPKTGATSSAFTFNTYFGSARIDTSTSLTIKPDTFNEIKNTASSRDVVTVNTGIKLTISFSTTNPIPANAQIKFYIPTDQALIDTTTFGATDMSGIGSVGIVTTLAGPTSNYNTFTLKEWCSDDNGGLSCPNTFTSKVQISGMKNPANARFPTNSIKIEIYTSAGDKIDAVSTDIYTIPMCNYGAMQGVLIARTVNTVGLATTYTFTFQTNSNGDLGTTGFVNILFPVAFLFDKTSPTPTCTVKISGSAAAATSTTCTPTKVADPNNMGNYISRIVASLQCGTLSCGGAQTYEFSIIGYSNPFSTKPRDGQIISTSTSTGSGATAEIKNVLDQVIGTDILKTQLSDFTAGTITVTSLIRTVLNVDATTNMQFSLTFPTKLEKSGIIQVSVPSTQFVPNGDNFQYQQSTGTSTWGSSQTLQVSTQSSTETVFIIKEWCSGSNQFCTESQAFKFQIVKGFANVGYVSTPTNFFTISTYTRDNSYVVDTVTNVQATPAVIPAAITVSSITFSTAQAAISGITVDINLKFGATIKPTVYVLLTFDTEFIRKDAGDITCFYVYGGVESSRTCTITQTSSVINTIKIDNFCTTACDDALSFTIRLKNVVNRLYVDAFSGNLLIETRYDTSTIVGTVTYGLSNVATLSPGQLTATSVTRSKATQGVAADYTITWTIPGYLIDDSLVEIRLPLNQVILSTGAAFTFKDASNANALTFSVASGSPTAVYNIAQGTEWKCTGTCSAGVTFTVTVSNAKNPFIQSTNYDAFVIIHKRTDGKLIFQSASPLNASPDLAFGVIDTITITHQNQAYVSRATEYVFLFTVQDDIPQGGKLKVTFPASRALQYTTTTMSCSVGGSLYTCTPTFASGILTNVIVSGICPSAVCTAPIVYTMTLTGGMKNPASVPLTQTGQFVLESISSSNFIVSQGKLDHSKVTNILPEPIVANITRSSPYMAAVNDYRVWFETINTIPTGGYIRVIFPIDQVLTPTNGPTCKIDFALTTLQCQIVFKPTGFVWVDIKSPCTTSCAAGYSIQLLFQSLQNPSSFLSNSGTSSWGVYTMNSNKEYIDGQYSGLKATPDLIGKTAIIKAIEIEDTTVLSKTYMTFLIVPGAQFTSEALFDFYFPDQLSSYYGNNICYVVIGSFVGMSCQFSFYPSGYIQKVILSKPCPYGCEETGIYLFKIPIQNRIDNFQTSGTFTLIERYSEVDVGMGTLLNTLTIVPDFISDFYITNDGKNTVQQESKIYLSFKAVNYVPNKAGKGRIRVVIPSQLTPNSNSCQIRVDGDPSRGTCSISNRIMLIYHTSSTIVGQNLTIEISKIYNPSTTRPTDPFLVYTERDSQNTGTYYQIDQNIVNITYNVTEMLTLLDIAITRSAMNDQTGYQTGQTTQLFFNMQLRNALESTSSIIVQMPLAAQAMISPSTSTATCYSTDSKGVNQNLLLCEIITSNRTIIVRNYCQVSACKAKSKVYFKMYDDFIQNFNYVIDPLNGTTDSMLVRTTTKEGYYFIDQTSKDVFIKPDLVPTYLILPSPEIIRTNNVINRKVSWVLSFKLNKNSVPQGGYIVLTVPRNVLLTIKNSSIDVKNYDTSVIFPNFTQNLYSDGLSVQNVTIKNFCNKTTGCLVGSAYSLLIDWIKNPISQLGNIDTAINISVFTKEGYAVEKGVTPPVYKLFSELIPVNIQNLYIRPINPIPNVITNYEFSFSADAEFNITDQLVINFPPEIAVFPKVTTSRMLAASRKCVSMFQPWVQLNCSQLSNNSILIKGLFTNNFEQYGVRIYDVQNPINAGSTSGFLVEAQSQSALTIASRSTNTRITIYEKIDDQSKCNKVCGSCAGTTATCTTCKNPSKYPIFRNYACVDNCGDGYFFDVNNLQCVQCHHGCSKCSGQGNNQCFSCSTGYFMEDGQCVPYCTKGLIEDTINSQCRQSNSSLCDSNCQTCSLTSNFCLTCKQNSNFPILDTSAGKCIIDDQNQCNSTQGSRFFIDQTTQKCSVCNGLCKTCERSENICTSCWEFQLNNIVNELYETCVDVCGLGTWYNKDQNLCSYCNSVCLICSGYESDQCLVCNKTPEARQLYLFENECVLQCPQRYFVNDINNECEQGQAQILSFSFLFMFISVLLGIGLVIASMVKTKNKNKTTDIIYAIISAIEAFNRLFLLGNMWFKSNVFALAVCFMNLIATCAIAVFFNFLFMTPIYAHSPHFRTLYKKFSLSYQTITCISYFSGVNIMRLLCSGFLNVESLQSDLNNWKFFLVPLNTMANFTVIFTLIQTAINVFIIMTLTIADDAFVFAILGLFLNVIMVIIQIFKHLNVKTFLIRRS
ncbi:UNKNOWN [Stylonychia lemnae]|uniref:Uncharacterized protein n=1 Tax=Stylonychia lemnae TaxID=5949 RepID=A0A078B6N4_STYLE|nr:UNKNOWN [Stylonychia lemnae]|eukprot:CDW89223.1 UNKNOWN [Stylonychia lemnae]